MKYQLVDQNGARLQDVELRDDLFGIEPHAVVVHQALLRQLANARQGTHDTKTRGEVEGSTKKLFRQKGTGRARQGGVRAPHRRGGGTVFGPHPRSYRQAMPRKMRRLAIRSVLSAKARDGELILVQALAFPEPKTRVMVQVLKNLRADGSTMIATQTPDAGVILAARNLDHVFTLPAGLLNVGDLLRHKYLVLTLDAARHVESLWSSEGAGAEPAVEPEPVTPARPARARRTARPRTEQPVSEEPAEEAP